MNLQLWPSPLLYVGEPVLVPAEPPATLVDENGNPLVDENGNFLGAPAE